MPKIPALPYVRSSITRGLSANAAYREYQGNAREAGATGMRRQDFLRLYSQTRNLRGQAEQLLDAPKNIINGGVNPEPRDTISVKGYGYWVAVYQRTVGQQDFMSTPYLVKSHEQLTPAEAERRVGSFLVESEDVYNRTVLGVGLVGVEQFNPSG